MLVGSPIALTIATRRSRLALTTTLPLVADAVSAPPLVRSIWIGFAAVVAPPRDPTLPLVAVSEMSFDEITLDGSFWVMLLPLILVAPFLLLIMPFSVTALLEVMLMAPVSLPPNWIAIG